MKQYIYSVYDVKAAAYLPPFFAVNDAVAHRNFVTAQADPDHIFAQHKDDFSLARVGEWDDLMGIVTADFRGVVNGDTE